MKADQERDVVFGTQIYREAYSGTAWKAQGDTEST